MKPIVLFVIMLLAGVIFIPVSRQSKGVVRVLLFLFGLFMIVIAAYGILTSFL